jgi:hypothetical protein
MPSGISTAPDFGTCRGESFSAFTAGAPAISAKAKATTIKKIARFAIRRMHPPQNCKQSESKFGV